jgi:hypothetical protein
MAADEKKRQEEESKEPEAKKPQSQSPPLTTELVAPPNEITTFTLPGTSIDVPVPRAEIVSTAVILLSLTPSRNGDDMAAQDMQVGIGPDGVPLVQQLTTFDSSAQLVREPFTF